MKDKIVMSSLAWRKVCSPKLCGGLGLKKFEDMNLAILCTLKWALAAENGKLWCRPMKAKYFPHNKFLNCKRKFLDSWHWKSIMRTIPIIKKGFCWNVGKKDSMDYWEDPWIPQMLSFLP